MSAITHTFRFSGYGEDFGPRADGLVILHTTESVAQRNTVADALVVAKWQDHDGVAGSYNRLIASDGVLSCVPDENASGGVNPWSIYFKPVSWLYQLLDPKVVNNPNYYALQLSAVGQRAWFDANGWPDGIIDGFARSIIDEEKRIGRGVVVANHANFQPGNRSDAGSVAMNLTMKRYEELMAMPKATFVDVSPDSPFFADVEWLAKTGITGGIGSGKFGPKGTVTREQMAAFLHRYHKWTVRNK